VCCRYYSVQHEPQTLRSDSYRKANSVGMDISTTYAVVAASAILFGGCVGSFDGVFPKRGRHFAVLLRGIVIGFLFTHLFPLIIYALYQAKLNDDSKIKLSIYFLILLLSYVLLRAFEEWMNAGNAAGACCNHKGDDIKFDQHDCGYRWEFKEKPLYHLIVVLFFSLCGAVWWTLESNLIENYYDLIVITIILMIVHGFNSYTVGELQNFNRKCKWVYIGQPIVIVSVPFLVLLFNLLNVFSSLSSTTIAYILIIIAAIVTAWTMQSVQNVTSYIKNVTRSNIAVYYLCLTTGIVAAFLICIVVTPLANKIILPLRYT